ncbi:hypothetical protein Ancab_037693 [Ancistrocladus abbreviatus]
MEKHRCKLCFRRFANGRALGGHMRSHMMNLPIRPKPQPPLPLSSTQHDVRDEHGSETAKSASSPSSSSTTSSFSSGEEDEEKGLPYGLRENPKRSILLVDPQFPRAAAATGTSSMILQDRESETESSKMATHRQSKRKSGTFMAIHHHNIQINEETEPASSISEVTPEEDIAFCLMMLSRDKWNNNNNKNNNKVNTIDKSKKLRAEDKFLDISNTINNDDIDSKELMGYPRSRNNNNRGGKYKCETCKKVFRSYQALGGHRASHKKIRALREEYDHGGRNCRSGDSSVMVEEKKIHECPVCFRVFASGQALGGHKRSHVIGAENQSELNIKDTRNSGDSPPRKFGDNFIDLNLPAPLEDDEISQIALSAVSDAPICEDDQSVRQGKTQFLKL